MRNFRKLILCSLLAIGYIGNSWGVKYYWEKGKNKDGVDLKSECEEILVNIRGKSAIEVFTYLIKANEFKGAYGIMQEEAIDVMNKTGGKTNKLKDGITKNAFVSSLLFWKLEDKDVSDFTVGKARFQLKKCDVEDKDIIEKNLYLKRATTKQIKEALQALRALRAQEEDLILFNNISVYRAIEDTLENEYKARPDKEPDDPAESDEEPTPTPDKEKKTSKDGLEKTPTKTTSTSSAVTPSSAPAKSRVSKADKARAFLGKR